MPAKLIAFMDSNWFDDNQEEEFFRELSSTWDVEHQRLLDWRDATWAEGATTILATEKHGEDLRTFKHPEYGVYVFGRSLQSDLDDVVKPDHFLKIESPNVSSMFAPVAAAIILYDRFNKL